MIWVQSERFTQHSGEILDYKEIIIMVWFYFYMLSGFQFKKSLSDGG